MQAVPKTQYKFSDLVEEAGIGTLIWSNASYFAATYYHYIVAAFTAGILLLSLLFDTPWWFVLVCLAAYGVYFGGRKRLTPRMERIFYRPDNQFLRAQVGFLAVFFLLLVNPGVERTPLWLLFIPVILLTSKHCSTVRLYFVVAESSVAVIAARVWHQWPILSAAEFISANYDLLLIIFWIGFLSFILHFLVRHIQARDETIAAYYAVSTLGRDVDMTGTHGVNQWQPLLLTLLKYLGGECVSVWMNNPQTRRLQLVASINRNGQNRDEIDFREGSPNITVPIDGPALIAQAARTGEFCNSIARPKSNLEDSSCRGACPICSHVAAELVVPINSGTAEQRSTLGVLSVGFLSSSFKEKMLGHYRNFVQGLVNQAKPMLIYAQRLEELLALQNISRQVSHSLDLNQVLDSILKAIVDTLGFEFASISLVDEDRRLVCSVRGINVSQKWLEMSVHALDSDDIQADIIRTGKTEVISGWDPRFDRKIWSKFGHENMIRIFTPIGVIDEVTHRERNIGTIEAGYYRSTRSEITADQRRMLEAFETQASMAVEQAQLLQRVQKKADILTSLHRVGQVIASARQPNQVLEEIGRSAAELLRADIVMLYRYHRDRRVVEPPVIFGDLGRKFRPNLDLNQQNILTRLLNETVPYYSADAQSDQWLIVQTASESDKAKPKDTFIRRQNIKSFAAFPLLAHGEIVGVMFVNYRARHQFNADEIQVHELFAQQAAVAIKNSEINELERELVMREERNHLSRELHHSVSQALFGIKLQAQNAINNLGETDGQICADLSNIMEIAHVASNETGFIIDELRAPIEESRHLVEGLDEYARRIKKWYGFDVTLENQVQWHPSPQVEQKLLRFAREALNNVIRHARCRRITVDCRLDEKGIWLSVRDDGIGFEPSRIPTNKLGLTSMRELAESVGGKFLLQTALGAGTIASVQIPLEKETEEYA